VRIAVPSGVGDVYWALTKLRSFRERHGAETVELRVQRSKYRRALEWAEMVDFVDGASDLHFKPDAKALRSGFSEGLTRGADYCFWPNAVIDRGEHISRWLDGYDLDLDFEVKCESPPDERKGLAVLYPSSVAINTAWLPNLKTAFWSQLLDKIPAQSPTGVIGAFWDMPWSTQFDLSRVVDMVGHTTLKQVAGVIREAKVIVGVISGMTILANHFKTPCVALCPDKFAEGFTTAWVKPDAPYIALSASEIHSADQIAELALSIAR